MTTETIERLKLTITIDDPATEHLKKLRGEMEALTGGQTASGVNRTQRHVEELQARIIPLYGTFKQSAEAASTLVSELSPAALGITAIGTAATGAILNFERFMAGMGALSDQQRALGIAAASLKKIEEEWTRAGMPEEERATNKAAIAKAMADIRRDSSELTKELRAHVTGGTEEQIQAMNNLIAGLRAATPEEFVNLLKKAGQAIYDAELARTKGDEQMAAQKRNRFLETFGVTGFSRPWNEIKNATEKEKSDLKEINRLYEAFGFQIRRSRVAFGNIADAIGAATLKYTPALTLLKGVAEQIKKDRADLEKWRKEGKAWKEIPAEKFDWKHLLPDMLRPGSQNPFREWWRPKKQSYGMEIGGARVTLASYGQNARQASDSIRVTRALTEQVQLMNAALRTGRSGAGGAVPTVMRAALGGGTSYGLGGGGPGGGEGYGGGGGAYGGGHGTTREGYGQAARRPGMNLPPDEKPFEPDAEGKWPIQKWPGTSLPSGESYSAAPGGGQWNVRGDIPYQGIDAAIRYRNPGAHEKSARNEKWGTTGFGYLNDRKGGHTIQKYPTWEQGIAANIDQIARSSKYMGRTIGDAIYTWSGGGRSSIGGNFSPNQRITPDLLNNPDFLRDWFAGESPSLQKHLTDERMNAAIELYKSGGVASAIKKGLSPADVAALSEIVTPWGDQPIGGKYPLGRAIRDVTGTSVADADRVIQAQAREAGTRKGALDARLVAALQYAAEKSGLRVRVTSGGQRMEGARGAKGSHRHDLGLAGDFDLLDEHGNIVARNDPRRIQFLEEASAAGAGGAGVGYMKDEGRLKIHMGITGSGGPHAVGKGLGQYFKEFGTSEENYAIAKGVERFSKSGGEYPKFAGPGAKTEKEDVWGKSAKPGRFFDETDKLDRAIGDEVKSKASGGAKLEVNVRGPSGTKVKAEGSGVFTKTETNRVKEDMPKKEDEPVRIGGRTTSRTDDE